MTQSHKSVTMVELFYDLIFAYAVGRMAQALALPTHGFIAPRMLGEFLMMLLVFWVIWTYQTVLANRYFNNQLAQSLFTLFNMFWVIVLNTAINVDFVKTKWSFQLSTAILFFECCDSIWSDLAAKPCCFTQNFWSDLNNCWRAGTCIAFPNPILAVIHGLLFGRCGGQFCPAAFLANDQCCPGGF